MAGPTPVSALIHAATMVTAGVYLIVRSDFIYTAAPDARLAVALVGAVTLVFGAIVGCAKDDIKKALAASTMSQIGYMMLAAGLGPIGYAFAIFHLLTHGFFKAGMFLGAGSVMHGMRDQVNMRRYGALALFMKITWVTFGLGWLAIIGVPPFSGFWSKDKIIESAFVGEGWQPWVLGGAAMLGAGVTAFYMSRLFFMTFHGEKRWEDDQHPHESPLTMTIPMMVLAFGSAFLGLILGPTGIITSWLAPVVGETPEDHPVLPVTRDHGAHPGPGRDRRVLRLADVRRRRGARGRPQGLPAHRRRPPGPLPGRRQRGPVHAPRHPPDPRAGLRRRARGRRCGRWHWPP